MLAVTQSDATDKICILYLVTTLLMNCFLLVQCAVMFFSFLVLFMVGRSRYFRPKADKLFVKRHCQMAMEPFDQNPLGGGGGCW